MGEFLIALGFTCLSEIFLLLGKCGKRLLILAFCMTSIVTYYISGWNINYSMALVVLWLMIFNIIVDSVREIVRSRIEDL